MRPGLLRQGPLERPILDAARSLIAVGIGDAGELVDLREPVVVELGAHRDFAQAAVVVDDLIGLLPGDVDAGEDAIDVSDITVGMAHGEVPAVTRGVVDREAEGVGEDDAEIGEEAAKGGAAVVAEVANNVAVDAITGDDLAFGPSDP